MEPNSSLTNRYPDLVSDRDDPDLRRLVGDLDELHSVAEPSAAARGAIAAALRAKATGAPGAPVPRVASPGRWIRPLHWAAQRPFVAATLILALVLLGGAAFAVEPLIKQAFNMEPGTQQLLEAQAGARRSPRPAVERIHRDHRQGLCGLQSRRHWLHGGHTAEPWLCDGAA